MSAKSIEAHVRHGLGGGVVDHSGLVTDHSAGDVSGLMVNRWSLELSWLVVNRWSLDMSWMVVHRWSLDMSWLVVNGSHWSRLGEQIRGLVMNRNGGRSWSIGVSLGHRRLVDIIADPGVLLVHLRKRRSHGLGVVGDGAIEAAYHVLLGVGHRVLVPISQIANARLGDDSRPCGSQKKQQAGGKAEELRHVDSVGQVR